GVIAQHQQGLIRVAVDIGESREVVLQGGRSRGFGRGGHRQAMQRYLQHHRPSRIRGKKFCRRHLRWSWPDSSDITGWGLRKFRIGLELNAASTRKILLVTDKEDAHYTIGEAAEILQVSTRTLRHWDEIELLTPSWRSWGDHRLYSEADVERGMNILIYRGAGVALKDIAMLIDASAA